MKAYQMIALLLALSCCLGMMVACNPSQKEEGTTEPNLSVVEVPILHCAEGTPEDLFQKKAARLLGAADGTAVKVSGTYDLNTCGKYTVTCTWDGKTAQVSVWVYANSASVTINGMPFSGEDEVHLNYQKAAASNNFMSGVSITDSLGNALKVTKDKKSMRFENREGLYVVYYKATDAAGQEFTVRVLYDVTYEHYISVANGPALIFEESASFSADFDGVTDVWLEDSNGKIDPALYEIQENAVVLKKSYYQSYVGKKLSLKLCSEYGNANFYISVVDEGGYDEYMNKKITNFLSYKSELVTFQKVTGGVDGIQFYNAYRYTKSKGVNADDAQLTINNTGKYGKVTFKLYIKSSLGGASGDGVMEFQITDGAKFVSVKDADGNSVSVIDKNAMPYVVLDAGKVYTITLDLTEALYTDFRVWGAKEVEIYYYQFFVEEPTYEYVIDDVTKSIICKKSGETFGYFAWPTVTKLDGDRLIAVSSGFRQAHIDPEGKVVAWFSEDGGKTWSDPIVVADTKLDDRDAGVVYWNGKIIVSWFCASKVYYLNNNASKYQAWANTIDDAYDTQYMGGNYIISEDGGKTWSEIYSMPDGMFTPHGLIVNPEGGLTSVGYLKYDKVQKRWGTGIAVRTTTGEMDENGFIWSDAIVIADSDTQYSWDFHEPYGIYNDDGVLVVVMRANKGLYQCELQPGAEKFGDWHRIAMVQETPAHMIQHSSGVMVMTYGYRGIYIDANGKTVSYTERNKDTTLGIRARLSYDGGLTWTREVVLTHGLKPVDNGSDWGYTSSVELSDGRILTVYYQRTSGETMASIHQVIWSLPEAIEGEVTLTFVGGKAPNGSTDNGDGLLIDTVTGNVGDTIVLPENPTKEGYRFDGWCLDYAGNMPFTGTVYEKSVTLYAKWVKN